MDTGMARCCSLRCRLRLGTSPTNARRTRCANVAALGTAPAIQRVGFLSRSATLASWRSPGAPRRQIKQWESVSGAGGPLALRGDGSAEDCGGRGNAVFVASARRPTLWTDVGLLEGIRLAPRHGAPTPWTNSGYAPNTLPGRPFAPGRQTN